VTEFNPDVRNICLVDVIAIRTPPVVVPTNPMGLEKKKHSLEKALESLGAE
jgi:hypothetical protein